MSASHNPPDDNGGKFYDERGGQPVAPDDQNGLRSASWLMADKVTTVPRQRLGNRIGVLGGEDMLRLNRAILVFLGLA